MGVVMTAVVVVGIGVVMDTVVVVGAGVIDVVAVFIGVEGRHPKDGFRLWVEYTSFSTTVTSPFCSITISQAFEVWS